MVLKSFVLVAALVCTAVAGAVPSQPAAAQPAPPVFEYPALYRLDHGRWEQSLLFRLGDRVRFVMPFLFPHPGWTFPSGTFQVQRERAPFYAQPVMFRRRMDRKHGPHGYTIFSVEFRTQGTQWIGHWIAEASVTSRGGLIGATPDFTVLAHLPQVFTVADAIALCRSRPKLQQTILVGGVWHEEEPFGLDQIARGWIAGAWTRYFYIPVWWKHGVLRLSFPRGTNPGYPPPDGFLQVRSRLDCRSHTLTAVARPVS
ncbi:MAG TPA: hypothetical protein VKX16_17670 [Chloroflexota bacterium]|nr:hypothetical protein [Chloroflexota bacterium]